MTHPARHDLVLLLSAAVTACGDGSTYLRIVDAVDPGGEFTTVDVEVHTLEDVQRVSGELGQIYTGAEVSFTRAITRLEDRGQARTSIVDNEQEVNAHWVEDGDTIVGVDFDSLLMFTAYAHLERALLYFRELGVHEDATAEMPVYLFPELPGARRLGFSDEDNALFFLPTDSILLLEMNRLQDIPLGMNRGIMGHEYSHRINYYEMWGAELLAVLDDHSSDETIEAPLNLLKAVDEGIADFHGAVIMNDPAFVEPTLGDFVDGRDPSVRKQVQSDWLDGTLPLVGGIYDPYGWGAALASALWHLGDRVGHDTVGRAILDAQRALTDQIVTNVDYNAGEFEVELVRQLPLDAQDDACDELGRSHGVLWTAFAGVCP